MEYLILPLLLVIAFLYASVGQAGGTGYIAIMALIGLNAAVIKPSALVLNIAVSILTTIKYYRSGNFSWKILLILDIGAVPAAYVGGYLNTDVPIYQIIVGLIQLFIYL